MVPKSNQLLTNYSIIIGVDYVLPSENLKVVDSGVFWPARGEEGRKLLKDDRIGNGFGKAVSSDHRMTWIKAQL